LQSVGTTQWLVNRGVAKGLIDQSGSIAGQQAVRDSVLSTIHWVRVVPSWVVLTTVLLATTGICGTVILRSRAQFRSSSDERQRVVSEMEQIVEANRVLELDIQRLTKDPNTIELAARERLGMVKANDIVVTMESIHPASSNPDLVSFVR
jgi:cell division protein FtsB